MDWAYVTAFANQDITTVVGTIMASYKITLTQPLWDGRMFAAPGLHTGMYTIFGSKDGPSTWRVADTANLQGYIEYDVIGAVVTIGSGITGVAPVRPPINVLSTLSITVGAPGSDSEGYRAVYITYGGHELINTADTGATNYINVIIWASKLDNQTTLTEPLSGPLSDLTPNEVKKAREFVNSLRWEERSKPAPPMPSIGWTPSPPSPSNGDWPHTTTRTPSVERKQ